MRRKERDLWNGERVLGTIDKINRIKIMYPRI